MVDAPGPASDGGLAVDVSQLTPDEVVYWQWGFLQFNATIVFTWVVMVVMIVIAWLISRRLTDATEVPRGQNALEMILEYMSDEISEISGGDRSDRYLPFVGTIFLFIAVANLLAIVPGYIPPTASLSTTAALAGASFLAVPVFVVSRDGLRAYLRNYVEPTPIMLPFNLMSDLSRTVALAVRLFGNAMSGAKIVGILIAVIPFIFPVLFKALGLLTGLVQAYIFAVLAMVYIASGMSVAERPRRRAHDRSERSNA